MSAADRLDDAWTAHMAKRGIHNPLAGVLRPSDTDVFGNDTTPDARDIDIGWFVARKPYDAALPAALQPDAQAESLPQLAGAVVGVYARDDGPWVTVVEERTVDGKLAPRRRDWPVDQLDLACCYLLGQMARHAAAKKLCGVVGRGRGTWRFDMTIATGDEFLITAALALTATEREEAAAR